ncbi:MAG: PP2C family protein-serine/threonine phosphatase [Candidatus Omnitrophota bacterium]
MPEQKRKRIPMPETEKTEDYMEKITGTHRLFKKINESVVTRYNQMAPVEVLNMIFGPDGVICDGVITLYPDSRDKKKYFVRVSRVEEKTEYYIDIDTMPSGSEGFLSDAMQAAEPVFISDVTTRLTDRDFENVPWLADMRTALIVPTIGINGDPATSILFAREINGFSGEQIWKNVILTYFITDILINLLLRRQTDKAYKTLDEELETIGEIQRQLLPSELPDTPGIEWAGHYCTSTRAGGDYYDFFPLGKDMLGAIVADVSGHGSPAAVVMAMTRLLLHTYPGKIHPPKNVLDNMNKVLAGHILPGQFVTAVYAVFDLEKKRMVCSNAGHCYPLILRASSNYVEQVRSEHGMPLGVEQSCLFEDKDVAYEKGDIFLFFTDGITEAMNPEKDLYGEERLIMHFKTLRDRSAREIKDAILRDVDDFRSGVPFRDDVTLIVAKAV